MYSFDGEVVEEDTIATPEKQANFDFAAWFGRNNKDIRGPEVFEAARILKQELGFQKVGAIGYCWGGWAAFQVGAKGPLSLNLSHVMLHATDYHSGRNLVDCISVAHPTFLLPEEIDAIDVPVQIIAPENDMMFKPELKAYANKKIPELNIGYDYQYFPNLSHGFATRGDPNNMTQKAGLERAKNAAVTWFATWLKL